MMQAHSVEEYVINLRRHFHQYPELSFEEHNTLSRIKEELTSLGLGVVEIPRGGLYADISGKGPGRMVALRADVDALPVTEENSLDYASKTKGVMHACGHDAHISMLLGLARIAVENRKSFNGKLRLMFQVAEERPPGGAIALIKAGALKNCDFVLGQHVLSSIPKGTVASYPREAMAYADEFRVKIHGKGGHGSAPHETVDALVISTQFVNMAQTIVSRTIDPFLPAVVTFGTINAGYRYNIIAAHAELTGTVRTFDRNVQMHIRRELEEMLAGLCKSFGASYEFEFIEGYPAVINSPEVTEILDGVAAEIIGKENVLHPNPSMGGEDFAYYLHEIPGTFYFLGVGNRNKGISSPQHSPTYDIDEDAMKYGIEIMYRTALQLLGKPKSNRT